jgi:pyruvate dehydrogenase E2 component (dihydrolipoamide acetyltransferase)
MATAVIMPKQGQSVETCIITKWFKQKGESVSAGELLFSYETDKAAFDLESPEDGLLLGIFFPEGSEVPVLANVAVIGKQGESISSFIPGDPAISSAEPDKVVPASLPSSTFAEPVVSSAGTEHDQIIRISPRARIMAREKGLDIASIRGSGPNGRIIASDIESATSVKFSQITEPTSSKVLPGGSVVSTGSDYSDTPLSNVRKIISRAMHSSLQNSAQLTHHMSADVRRLLVAREKVKKDISENKVQQDITLNDMICWCVIRALEKFPEANSHFLGEKIRTFSKVHIGLAVDTPRGLMVPAIKNAGDLHLTALSKALKSAADSCKKGNISPELLQSDAATFTVSNLGAYGVEMFTPVINLPQVGILGVCTIVHRPANLGNNIFGFVPYIGLSLTYDHRAIDGGPATLFLKEIKNQIENFNINI